MSLTKPKKVPEIIENEGEPSAKRELRGSSKRFISVYTGIMALAQIYIIIFASLPPMVHVASFLAFLIPLVFMLYKPRSGTTQASIAWYDWILALLSSVPFIYVALFYDEIIARAVAPTEFEIILSLVAVLAVLETGRRTIGIILPLIAVIFLAYVFFGPYLPGILQHRGYGFDRLTSTLFMSTNGLFGAPTQVAATMVFMFVFFGAFLSKTGASKAITDLAMSVAGRFTGGPAKVSVIASAGMGSVSGSANANVATTGPVTIPLMKSVGYSRTFAGATEAAASTGGTLMPPIMGAAAFVMAEITGTPYADIVLAAIIPALLYYASIFVNVHFQAVKEDYKGMPFDKLPRLMATLKSQGILLLPIVLLTVLILMYIPIMYAAFASVIGLIIIAVFHPRVRLRLRGLWEAISASSDMVVQAATACVCAGVVIGVLNLTGLGLRFSSWTLGLAGTSVILALVFTMIITIILGMGLPPVAAYLVGASITAPALVEVGFPLLASHLFVFYFSCLASITPPVGIAAFIASGIAGARPMRTAITACILGLPAFVVPFLFMYVPEYLLQGSVWSISYVFLTALLGFFFIAIGFIGYLTTRLNPIIRLLVLVGGILLLLPFYAWKLSGLVLAVGSLTLWTVIKRQGTLNKVKASDQSNGSLQKAEGK